MLICDFYKRYVSYHVFSLHETHLLPTYIMSESNVIHHDKTKKPRHQNWDQIVLESIRSYSDNNNQWRLLFEMQI